MLERLKRLHEENQQQEIVDMIEALQPGERTYEIESLYGRALNNLDREADALAVLERIREQGEQEPLWHWRIGYSLYYLDREAEAAEHLQKAIDLGDDSEATRELLQEAKRYAAAKMEAAEHYEARWKNRRLPEPGAEPFYGFDFSEFWDDSAYALKSYVSDPPTDALIAEIEAELDYKLPESYLRLMKRHNGGVPKHTDFPSERNTSWAEDHVAISGIFGIGRSKDYSLCGGLGSQFMIEEWGYPEIGVAICDCPSAGHDMIFLDYSHCGKDGEPAVVHIDQESDYRITYLADSFEDFIRGLYTADDEDDEYTAEGYDPERTVDGSGFPAFDGSVLLRDMLRDAYYPRFLVERVSGLLLEVIAFISGGVHTYGEVQAKLDEAVIAINGLQDEFDENDSEIETVARESIGESVELILKHFGIEIDTEQAIRERDW